MNFALLLRVGFKCLPAQCSIKVLSWGSCSSLDPLPYLYHLLLADTWSKNTFCLFQLLSFYVFLCEREPWGWSQLWHGSMVCRGRHASPAKVSAVFSGGCPVGARRAVMFRFSGAAELGGVSRKFFNLLFSWCANKSPGQASSLYSYPSLSSINSTWYFYQALDSSEHSPTCRIVELPSHQSVC